MSGLCFDGVAGIYDETRTVDAACLESALAYLVERFPPDVFRRVVYPGIGTGRIALPLARKGYRIFGLDLSTGMLSVLRHRLGEQPARLAVTLQVADAACMPFGGSCFDLAVTVHFLHIVRQWRRVVREMLRVVRDGGSMVLMATGLGTEVPFLNERYHELCAESGSPIKRIGAESRGAVLSCFRDLGCRVEEVRDRWEWVSRLRVGDTLSYMGSRAFSFTLAVPDAVHASAMAQLEVEAKDRFGSLSAEVGVPNQIRLAVISRERRRGDARQL